MVINIHKWTLKIQSRFLPRSLVILKSTSSWRKIFFINYTKLQRRKGSVRKYKRLGMLCCMFSCMTYIKKQRRFNVTAEICQFFKIKTNSVELNTKKHLNFNAERSSLYLLSKE